MQTTRIQSPLTKWLLVAAFAVIGVAQTPAFAFSLTDIVVHEATREAMHYGMHKAKFSPEPKNAPVAAEMSVTQGKPNTACPQFQAYGFPEPLYATVTRRAFYTCRAGYAGMYDPTEKTPVWVAERITKDSVNGHANRKGMDFAEDPQIPHLSQGHREDFKRSGYDMGHMAPSADFRYSDGAMSQTFLLSNAVPQEPSHNRGIWANLEGAIREMAARRGELYVVTGPIYTGPAQRIREGRTVTSGDGVAIPTSLYKVVVDRKTKEMTAFIIPNNSHQGDDPARFQVSVRDVEKVTGLNFNPALSRADADRQEVGGGSWVIPKVRIKFND